MTSQAEIAANITTQPLSSLLKFTAVSKNANINASLPAEYEGSFSLVSSRGSSGGNPGGSVVKSNKETRDPTGNGRTRYVDVKSVFGPIITGSVEWREGGSELFARDRTGWEEFTNVLPQSDDAEGEESDLVGGWKILEEFAADKMDELSPLTVKDFVGGEQQREPGSGISLVTSSATNYLLFA